MDFGCEPEIKQLSESSSASSAMGRSAPAMIARLASNATAQSQVQPKSKSAINQRPIKPWPEDVRGVPNAALRSALFGAIKKGNREYLEQMHVASLDGQEIHYTGTRLDQGDLTVWECVLHLARVQAMEQCRFTAYAMLKLMGKTDTGKNRKLLHKRLLRLKACAVEITQANFSYMGSLIKEAYKDEANAEYVVMLDAKLHVLFPSNGFTYVDWSIRSALEGQPLAQWLHGFYSSHAKPFPMKVATLHRLCGSEANEIWKFTQTLRRALGALSSACKAHGESFSYGIRGDLVDVVRQPSNSQQRHLLKGPQKPRKLQQNYRPSG
jgi:hypothetical protein